MKALLTILFMLTAVFVQSQELSAIPDIYYATNPVAITMDEVLLENHALKTQAESIQIELQTAQAEALRLRQKLNVVEIENLEYQIFLRRLVIAFDRVLLTKETETIFEYLEELKTAILKPMENRR